MNENKSSRYHRLKRQSAVLSLLTSALMLSGLLATGASRAASDLAARGSGSSAAGPFLHVATYVVGLAALNELLAFPFAIYAGWLLERRYGLSTESLRSWATAHAKSALLGLILAVAGAEILYAMLRSWPVWWWAGAAATFAVFLVVLSRLAPVVLLPLFYTFTPLQKRSLVDRLEALSTRAGVAVLGAFEWNLGRRSRRANAALVGAGGGRRIILSDTLLADYSDDEIEVILAHELAHHAHHDIGKALAVECALLFGALFTAAQALRWEGERFGLHGPADVAGLPLILLAAGGVAMLATPVLNALSRRNERRADRYALEMTRQPAAFVSAMRRLAAQNLAEERPSRTTLWFFHTHPPIEERIDAARRLA